ncbi:hypothetical protein DL95DRAFT_463399 [Leptodontidium sp. 2 PMI_412]|nr:hypothetical protein DL95DRAFT_463399 [Leptodontidium sp. 2 PMI_412]
MSWTGRYATSNASVASDSNTKLIPPVIKGPSRLRQADTLDISKPKIDNIPPHGKLHGNSSKCVLFTKVRAEVLTQVWNFYFATGLHRESPPVAHFKVTSFKESPTFAKSFPLPDYFDLEKLPHMYELLNLIQASCTVMKYYNEKKDDSWMDFSINFDPSDNIDEAWEFGCDCHGDCESHRGEPPDPLHVTISDAGTGTTIGPENDSLQGIKQDMFLRLNNFRLEGILQDHEPCWQDLISIVPPLVLNSILSTFKDYKPPRGITNGDFELSLVVERSENTEPFARHIPRDVLTSVYNFCKENLITGHVVTEALPRLRVSSPTEITSVITFAEPVPGQTVAVEQLD